jgi:hypothetical protein
VIFIAGCSKDEKNADYIAYPQLTIQSPLSGPVYPADSSLIIKGQITDITTVTHLSILIFKNNTADTLFYEYNEVNALQYNFHMNWQPDTNFSGLVNTFILAVNVYHDSTQYVPFYQNFRIAK